MIILATTRNCTYSPNHYEIVEHFVSHLDISHCVVFDDVADIVTTPQDFSNLQRKYKDNGMLVGTIAPYQYGRRTDNITVTSA